MTVLSLSPCSLPSVDSAARVVCQMSRSEFSFYHSEAQLPGAALLCTTKQNLLNRSFPHSIHLQIGFSFKQVEISAKQHAPHAEVQSPLKWPLMWYWSSLLNLINKSFSLSQELSKKFSGHILHFIASILCIKPRWNLNWIDQNYLCKGSNLCWLTQFWLKQE